MSTLPLDHIPIPARTSEGLVRYLRHAPSGWVFRILPWRDPDQPRFWCLRVEACTSPSMAARTMSRDPFYTALAMTRQELTDTLGRIESDATTWFGTAAQERVRLWMLEIVRSPVPPPSEVVPRVSRRPVAG